MLALYVLIQLASKGGCKNLYSAANTKYRYLTGHCKTYQHEFLVVATRVDGDTFQRLFAKIIGVDIGSSGEYYSIQSVQN